MTLRTLRTRLLRRLNDLFCPHEWTRRRDGTRVYLECVKCLTTTPGLDLTPAAQFAAKEPVPCPIPIATPTSTTPTRR